MNSIAIIVKHLVGNMRSRWTDFLTSDGEKADRKRDTEFEDPPATRAAIDETVGGGVDLRVHCARTVVGCGHGAHGR